ncbi:uncharacterized protein LOC108745182 isoform X1 [Agrilus planipennis]|uniref:Uncharacterized protein LOC108745182 isoform X1 n=2 Tax=Agrilus planipennis TaxID=224129 RepID=A0A7F5RL28_AGRPL|nr:uncharacterized protein LOC108745182 isoform X1 [Agrilus planipennis]XP_025836645.1 uncharacterized protein LOC108745182 isoform X1 [Agrilus planipennis]XP_025836646.1 uncharacterized protein LOC108745182 isoform X1 [Agrilus planipennis]
MSNLNCPPRRKRSSATDSSSQPQASLSRSTPIRENSPIDDVPSPNISSIRSSSNSSSRNVSIKKQRRLFDVENQTSLLLITNVNSEDKSSDSEESTSNVTILKQFKNKGRNWRFIKPTNQNNLYFKILSKREDIESLALNWCKHYVYNKEEAIIEMQQLFIDLTGVRKFNLKNLLESNSQLEKVFETLENVVLNTDLEKYCLCNSTHQYSITCLEEICKFLRLVWIISSNQTFLYDCYMSLHVLKLINLMANSKVKVIHHTGLFLAIKIITFLTEVHRNIIKNPLDNEEQERYLSHLSKNEEGFILLLHKCCCTTISAPQRAKMQYLEEILQWFKRIPSLMLNKRCFNSLLELVADSKDAKIRQKAVAVSKDLVALPKFSQYIIPNFATLLEAIEERMWDIDYDVCINAVEFFGAVMSHYPQYLNFKLEVAISTLMLQKNYPLARAAGQFTIKSFRRDNENNEDIDVIHKLMQLLSVPKFLERIALLVESVIDFARELQNYDLIFTMLMREDSTEEEDIILCSLLSQSVVQIATGRSPVVRDRCRKEKPQELVNQKIAYFFITRLYDLMRKFSSNALCTKSFCEILLVFNYEETPLTHYNKYLDQLMNLQESLFINSVNEDVLDSFSKLYSTWMAEYCPFKLRASAAFDIVLEKTVKVYKLNLEEYNEEKSELVKSNLEIDLLHLEVLFRYNDLRKIIDWNTLFVSWDLNDEYFTIQSIERNMKCCYWFLLWEARGLKDLNVTADLLQQKIDQLELKCASFISQCLIIMSQNQEKPTLLQTAFDVIIDLHLEYLNELSAKFSKVQPFKQLHLKVSTTQAQNVLVDYVLSRAFTAVEKKTLKMRRSNLAKLMNAFIEDIIPHEEHFTKVFMFYDEYYENYFDIFNTTLDMFQKLGGVAVTCSIIVLTIRYSYIEYLTLKGNFDSAHPEIEQINALGQRFLQYLKSNKAAEDSVLGVLKHAVSYTSSVLEHRHFLHFFNSFIPALKINQHKELFDHIMKCMPEGDEDAPEAFVRFAKKLNCKKGKSYSSL